jgi:hypothetical protein
MGSVKRAFELRCCVTGTEWHQNLLCQRNMDGAPPPLAGIYNETPLGRAFSLRPIGDFDVKNGRGGHKNAAAFRVPLGWVGECSTRLAKLAPDRGRILLPYALRHDTERHGPQWGSRTWR